MSPKRKCGTHNSFLRQSHFWEQQMGTWQIMRLRIQSKWLGEFSVQLATVGCQQFLGLGQPDISVFDSLRLCAPASARPLGGQVRACPNWGHCRVDVSKNQLQQRESRGVRSLRYCENQNRGKASTLLQVFFIICSL